MIKISSSGSFQNTDRFLSKMSKGDLFKALDRAGRQGVDALASATPFESGITADSWNYEVSDKGYISIIWTNSHVVGGVPLVILLQYGHGTGTGGYVQGRDFINPALRPIFDRIAADVWKEVVSA